MVLQHLEVNAQQIGDDPRLGAQVGQRPHLVAQRIGGLVISDPLALVPQPFVFRLRNRRRRVVCHAATRAASVSNATPSRSRTACRPVKRCQRMTPISV